MSWQNILVGVQASEFVGHTLLVASAIVSALLTEALTSKKESTPGTPNQDRGPNKVLSAIGLALTCLVIFVIEFVAVFALVFAFAVYALQVLPQGENILILLRKIVSFCGVSLMIPFVTAMAAGVLSRSFKAVRSKAALCIFLALTVLLSSVEFFLSAFQWVQRPNLPLPAEAVSYIVNSRLRVYPFALSGDELGRIGDGSELLISETNDVPPPNAGDGNPSGADTQPVEYEEPNSLSGYINAIFDGTYAPGMGKLDYLHKAYEYYQAGQYTNSDYFYIGVMWKWIYNYFYDFSEAGLTSRQCLEEALAAYEKAEQRNGESAALYNNIAVVYAVLNDWEEVRIFVKRALEISSTEGSALSNFKSWIQSWVGSEPYSSLMEDASTVLLYEQNLSMYILYGACAVAENTNLSDAYDLLCAADDYYQGKSAMVKILRCICADLTGQDESRLLNEIYTLERTKPLTSTEELYLIRYLFATNRYEELWGYIAKIGSDTGPSLNAELAAIKASWYFRNQSSGYFSQEDAEQLLEWIKARLESLPGQSEERQLLLLAQMLLQSCLGEMDDIGIEPDVLGEASDLEYALIAVKAFNSGKYQEAIDACERFFDLIKTESEPSDDGGMSWQQLTPQEQLTLSYHIQLVLAYSHFEYAEIYCWKESDEWTAHMDAAERECAAFEQSSKSLLYIGEQFKILQDNIDKEHGRIPKDPDETPIIIVS